MNESLYGRSNIGKVVHLMRRLGTELMLLAGYDSSTVFVRIYNPALFLLKCTHVHYQQLRCALPGVGSAPMCVRTCGSCRVSENDLRKCGGWNKTTAMEIHYMTSAAPGAACASAGFRGTDDYCPIQKYAEPSDTLINLVFGVVLVRRNPTTGVEEGLNVGEAIDACKQLHDQRGASGVSATPLFEVIRLLAKALLQVIYYCVVASKV